MDSVNQLLNYPAGVVRMPEADRVCLYQLAPLLSAIATQTVQESGRPASQVSLLVLFTSRAGVASQKLVTASELVAMAANADPGLQPDS